MEDKSGVKTTEFWVSLSPIIMSIIEGDNFDEEQSKYMIVAGAILCGLYIISRTMVKCRRNNATTIDK